MDMCEEGVKWLGYKGVKREGWGTPNWSIWLSRERVERICVKWIWVRRVLSNTRVLRGGVGEPPTGRYRCQEYGGDSVKWICIQKRVGYKGVKREG